MDISSLEIPVKDFFNLLLQSNHIGCWVIDVKNYRSWWSDSYYNLLGYEDKTITFTLDDFLQNLVHPEDRHIVTSSIKKYLYNREVSDRSEVRLRHFEGHYNWYETFSEGSYDEQNNLHFVYGGIINIDERKHQAREVEKLKTVVKATEEMLSVGVYERNFETGERTWSKLIYDIFELPYGTYWTIENVLNSFIGKDKTTMMKALDELKSECKPFDLELQIVTAKANQIWVRAMAMPIVNNQRKVTGFRGIFQRIEQQKLKENFLIDIRNKITEQNFFLDETSAMSHVGGWEFDLETNILYWSKQTKNIHEVPENFLPDYKEALRFYVPSSRELVSEHFNKLLATGKPYDLELELVTAKFNRIWIRSIGKPIYNKEGKITKVRGVVQNIHQQKQKEIELNEAIHIINGQNDKLKDFTYIVSHNLRSHAGNLQMITEMIDLETDLEVKLEWVDLIKNVSSSLGETVNNLNGLVTMTLESKKPLLFSETFINIEKALNYKLLNENVQLTSDFSACERVDYVPAYLESIMLNLITNAIKYRHPQREPVISVTSGINNNKPYLNVTDNGLGIDLKLYGNRIFKMNQTFHENSDARGIGLYITKNQVENMGGSIEVSSIVNEGTTFTIHF